MVTPWMNRNAVAAYRDLIRPEHRVLEFGAGNSTYWLDGVGCTVVSYEHDHGCALKTQAHVSDRINVIHAVDYHEHARETLQGQTFDVVVIDGRYRLECLKVVLDLGLVADGGWLILDDSQREEDSDEYSEMTRLIEAAASSYHRQYVPYDNKYGRWEALFAQF